MSLSVLPLAQPLRFEIVPEAVLHFKNQKLEDDIALSLSALGIRIIAPFRQGTRHGANQNPAAVQ